MKHHTLKYIFRKEVMDIFQYFTSLFGIRIAFFSADGEELQVGLDKPICKYCQLLREKLNFENACLSTDKEKRNLVAQKKELMSYQCHGGMIEAIMPVYYSDELMGFIMIGQFRSPELVIPAHYLQVWHEKYGTNEFEEAYKKTPCLKSNTIDDVLGLFSVLVKYITSRRMISPEKMNSIYSLVSYMEEHPEENLSLLQASELALCSTSTLSHQFKKITNKSFKQFQLDTKLARAKEMLKEDSGITIREIAYKLGYNDPLYFSKLYKKHFGCSPKSRLNKD